MVAATQTEQVCRDPVRGDAEFLRACAHASGREAAVAAVSAATERALRQFGAGLQLQDANLSRLDLSGFDLRGANMNRAKLHGTNLTDVKLVGASLICCGIERTKFNRADLSNAYLHAFSAQISDFSGARLVNLVDATGGLFHGCAFDGASFDGSSLAGVSFYQCSLSNVGFVGCMLQGTTFGESFIADASFEGAELSQAVFTKCSLRETSFVRAAGRGLLLQRLAACDNVDLSGARFPLLRLADLRIRKLRAEGLEADSADIVSCVFESASFVRASLARSRWLDVVVRDAVFDGSMICSASFSRCDFNGASMRMLKAENAHFEESHLDKCNLQGLNGRHASFRDCSLSESDLSSAYLYRASFTGDPIASMDMRGCNLRGANLIQSYIAADLTESNLAGTHCAYARLNQSLLQRAALCGANIFEASCVKTKFDGADLSGVEFTAFPDRCTGLDEALAAAGATDLNLDYVRRFAELLGGSQRKST